MCVCLYDVCVGNEPNQTRLDKTMTLYAELQQTDQLQMCL